MEQTGISNIKRRGAIAAIGGALLVPSTGQAQSAGANITFYKDGFDTIGVTEPVTPQDLRDAGVNIKKIEDDYFWKYDNGWKNPTTIYPGDACFVRVGNSASIGTWFNNKKSNYQMDTQTPAPIVLNSGWNMISTAYKTGIDDLGVAGILNSLNESEGNLFWHYNSERGWKRSNQMVPGRGYLAYSNKDDVYVPTNWYIEVRNRISNIRRPFEVDVYKKTKEFSNELKDSSFALAWIVTENILTGGTVSVDDITEAIEETSVAFSIASEAATNLSTVTYRNAWDGGGVENEYEKLEVNFSQRASGIAEKPIDILFEEILDGFETVVGATNREERISATEDLLDRISVVQGIIDLRYPIEETTVDDNETRNSLNKNVDLYNKMLSHLEAVIRVDNNS